MLAQQKKHPVSLALFFTLLLGILWQGGHLFWYGFAISSIILFINYLLIQNFQKNIHRPKGFIHITLVLFTLWCFVTVYLSSIPFVSFIRAVSIAALLLGLYGYFLFSYNEKKWHHLWFTVIGIGITLSFFTILELYLGNSQPNSLFFNRNTHAAYLNLIIIPTSAYFLLTKDKRTLYLLGFCLFLITYSHALPGSRGASFGQYLGLILLFAVAWRTTPTKRIVSFFVIYSAAYTLALLSTLSVSRFFAYKLEDTDNGRWEIWQGSIKLLENTPWYGNGVGTYWLLYPPYRLPNAPSTGQNPHNDYLQYLIEGGIPALVLLLLLVIFITTSWTKTLKRNDLAHTIKTECTALYAAFIAIGFHAFFTFNLGVLSILFLMGLLLGRFLYLSKQTSQFKLSNVIPIKSSILKFSSISITLLLVLFFARYSLNSYFYQQAVFLYDEGKITKVEYYNGWANALNPYDARPYILFAQLYMDTLKYIPELSNNDKKHYLAKAMQALETAEQLNPYRSDIYYLRALLIQNNPAYFKGNHYSTVINQYKKALKTDPRSINPTINLAKILVANNQIEKAQAILMDNIKRYHINNTSTYQLYQFGLESLQENPNPDLLDLLNTKIKLLIQYYKIQALPTPKAIRELRNQSSKYIQ